MEIQALEQAVAADPNLAEARLALGEALVAAGRASDALDHLRKAMNLKRDYLEAYLALGSALLAEDEHIAGIATLEGGREMARRAGRADLEARFDAALAGLGPVKRRAAGPADDQSFRLVARATLADIASRLRAVSKDITIEHTPSVLVFDIHKKAKMGISEQNSFREIWCTSALGEFKFRYIPSSKHWRTGDGGELYAVVSDFLARHTGAPVEL